MAKWAEFCIHARRPREGAIKMLKARMDDGGERMPLTSREFTRDEILSMIERKAATFTTMTRDPANGQRWFQGEPVRIYTTKTGKKYLRTDANEVEEDNLGNLPEF